jgi:hypothetical protein
MSDQRYAEGVIRGIKLSHSHVGAFYLLMPLPWPELPAVGALGVGKFSRCSGCKREWTFCFYGGWPACLGCATRKASR